MGLAGRLALAERGMLRRVALLKVVSRNAGGPEGITRTTERQDMHHNVRHIITNEARIISDHTVETASAEAREYGSTVTNNGTPINMEVRVRDGSVIAYRWKYVGDNEVHTVVFWPLADDAQVGDGFPVGIASTFRMSALTGEPKQMIHPTGASEPVHPSGATRSTDETGALDRLLYAVGRACEPLGAFGESKSDERRMSERITAEALDRLLYAVGRACEPLGAFGESKSDERRMSERITAEALVQFAHETGAVTEVDGEQIGDPARLLQVLIEKCGGNR